MYGAMSRGTIQMMRNLGFKKAATKPIETIPVEGQPAAPAEKPTETETP